MGIQAATDVQCCVLELSTPSSAAGVCQHFQMLRLAAHSHGELPCLIQHCAHHNTQLRTSCCACSMCLMTAGLWLTSVKKENVRGSASSPYTYLGIASQQGIHQRWTDKQIQ